MDYIVTKWLLIHSPFFVKNSIEDLIKMQYTLIKKRGVYLNDDTESLTFLYMYSSLAKDIQDKKTAEMNSPGSLRSKYVHTRRT